MFENNVKEFNEQLKTLKRWDESLDSLQERIRHLQIVYGIRQQGTTIANPVMDPLTRRANKPGP